MKKLLTPAVLTGALLLSGCQYLPGQSTKTEKDVVLKMEAGTITKDEFYNEMKKNVGEETLKKMVYQKIVADQVKVSEKEVDQKIEDLRNEFSSEEDFMDSLAANQIHSMEELRTELTHSLAFLKFSTRDIDIPEKEIKKVYKEKKDNLKVAHIFVPDAGAANDIMTRIAKGEDFEMLAQRFSHDDTTASKGGVLDYFSKGDMPEPFEQAAFALEAGEISQPVEVEGGYEIIKMIHKKTLSYDEMKDSIELHLKELDAPAPNIVFKELEENQNIEIFDKDLEYIFEAFE